MERIPPSSTAECTYTPVLACISTYLPHLHTLTRKRCPAYVYTNTPTHLHHPHAQIFIYIYIHTYDCLSLIHILTHPPHPAPKHQHPYPLLSPTLCLALPLHAHELRLRELTTPHTVCMYVHPCVYVWGILRLTYIYTYIHTAVASSYVWVEAQGALGDR